MSINYTALMDPGYLDPPMTVLLVESLSNPVVVQSRNLETEEQEDPWKASSHEPISKD